MVWFSGAGWAVQPAWSAEACGHQYRHRRVRQHQVTSNSTFSAEVCRTGRICTSCFKGWLVFVELLLVCRAHKVFQPDPLVTHTVTGQKNSTSYFQREINGFGCQWRHRRGYQVSLLYFILNKFFFLPQRNKTWIPNETSYKIGLQRIFRFRIFAKIAWKNIRKFWIILAQSNKCLWYSPLMPSTPCIYYI